MTDRPAESRDTPAPNQTGSHELSDLRAILAATNQGVYDLDLGTGLATVTPEYLSMIGEPPEPATFDLETFGSRLHPDDAPRILGVVDAYTRGEIDEYREEYRIRHRDGHWVWVMSIGRVVDRADDGTALRVLGTHTDITEHKEEEAALEHSETRHKTILDVAMDGFWLVDTDGSLLEANRAYAEMSGYSIPELLTMKVAGLESTETAPDTLAHIAHVLEHGQDRFESRHRRKDGSLFDVEVSVQAEPDGSGRLVVFLRDITERLRTRQALENRIATLTQPLAEDSDIAFEDLFDIDEIQQLQDAFAAATGVASIITHVDGTPITRPSSFCRLCAEIIRGAEKGRVNCYRSDAEVGRYRPEGPVVQPCMSGGLWDAGAGITVGGRHIANWLIGQVRDDTQSEESMVAYAREIGADEQEVVAAFREVPAMSREQFERVADALFLLASQLSRAAYQNVLQARFIAEKASTEQALRESEDKFKYVFEHSVVGKSLTTPDGEIHLNDAFRRLLGYSAEELASGATWRQITHPEDMEKTQQTIDGLLDGSITSARFNKRYVRKDGSTVWCDVSTSLRRDESGAPLYFMTAVLDITERMEAEQEIRRLNDELEERVRLRTEELSATNQELLAVNEELTETNLRLEEATRAKSDFLAAMSHELRTPLNSIIGFSGVLAQGLPGSLNEEQARQIEMISRSGQHLLGLINEVLDLAKIESGQIRPNLEVVEVCDLAADMLETIRPIARTKHLELRLDCSPDLLMVTTDPHFVSQILLNLLGNAVKFTQEGQIEVIVTEADDSVSISVADTGCGIASQDLGHIFEDFYQATPPDGSKHEGTGLGLAVSQRLADSLKATIEVASTPGRGTTFTLRLPTRE